MLLFCLIKYDKINTTQDAESTALKTGTCPPLGEDKLGRGNKNLLFLSSKAEHNWDRAGYARKESSATVSYSAFGTFPRSPRQG